MNTHSKASNVNSPVSINYLKPFCFQNDGFIIEDIPSIRTDAFGAVQSTVYGEFTPGRNANNKLKRGVKWGVRTPDSKYIWTERSSYQLSAELNPEEEGRVREFDLVPDYYLKRPEVLAVLEQVFNTLFSASLAEEQMYAHEVQVSAIRYEPTIAEIALPSPLIPHQDQISGGIAVMSKSPAVIGGKTRIYQLCQTPIYEFDMDVGNILILDDSQWLHQVTPMQLDMSKYRGGRQCRDVLLVRFERIGRA